MEEFKMSPKLINYVEKKKFMLVTKTILILFYTHDHYFSWQFIYMHTYMSNQNRIFLVYCLKIEKFQGRIRKWFANVLLDLGYTYLRVT